MGEEARWYFIGDTMYKHYALGAVTEDTTIIPTGSSLTFKIGPSSKEIDENWDAFCARLSEALNDYCDVSVKNNNWFDNYIVTIITKVPGTVKQWKELVS
jgi:hypothetical protein